MPIFCPPNIFSEPTEAYGRLLDRALLGKPNSTLGWSRRTHTQESTTQKAHAFVGTRAEDRGLPRDDERQISRTAPEVLRSRGRQRKSDQLFGMGNTGAGPRGWLKLVTKVPFDIGKPQLRPPRCDTRVTPEEKRRFLARRAQETEQRRALFNAETDAEET